MCTETLQSPYGQWGNAEAVGVTRVELKLSQLENHPTTEDIVRVEMNTW